MGASQSHGDEDGLVEAGEVAVLRHPKLRYVKFLRTAVGLLTVVMVFLAALDSVISISYLPVGIYLFAIVIPMFLLEFGFIIRLLCGTNGILCRSFALILDFDKKKRGVLYMILSIPLCLPNFRNNYSIVAGICVMVTALLYCVKGCEFKKVPTFLADRNVQQAREAHEEYSAI